MDCDPIVIGIAILIIMLVLYMTPSIKKQKFTLVPTQDKVCFDNDSNCFQWAMDGECKNNPTVMASNCRKSCDFCTSNWYKDCDDLLPSCSEWATAGECDKDKKYMYTNCRKSCGLCGKSPEQVKALLS